MFGKIISYLVGDVLVSRLANSSFMRAAARKTHQTVQAVTKAGEQGHEELVKKALPKMKAVQADLAKQKGVVKNSGLSMLETFREARRQLAADLKHDLMKLDKSIAKKMGGGGEST
eukprot:gb/GEZN01021227.1/.p1 GENE.gb/GEZN01021227.1/~~gb/GEZN01021227.1/.p1  ORF type:complete len:116 (+),score=24.73 gb/GEZN01021227.1/:171-518(+)